MDFRCWRLAVIVFLTYYVLLFVGAVIIMLIEANELENVPNYTLNSTKSLEQLLREELKVEVNRSSLDKIVKMAQDITAKQKRIDDLKWKRDISWRTLYKWRYFTHTTLTTVGFGDIVPETDGGKIFVIIYGTIGIPLNILVTTCIGFLLSGYLSKLIRRIDQCVFRREESYHVEFKTLILLTVMCVGWLSIGAGMTSVVMKWSWLEGYYAVFVKFSTIGYGDYTLDFSKVSNYWEVLSWYTNIGLAVVAGIFDALTKVVRKRNEGKVSQGQNPRTNDTELHEFEGCELKSKNARPKKEVQRKPVC